MSESTHPSNYNLAYMTNFKLEIPFVPVLNYFVQTVSLPSISLVPVETPHRNNNIFFNGNVLDFSNLSIGFILDEDHTNYTTLYDWIYAFRDENKWSSLAKDLKLTITNSNRIPIMTYTFYYAFPISISDVSFNSTLSDELPIQFTVEFKYEYFSFSR